MLKKVCVVMTLKSSSASKLLIEETQEESSK